MKLIYGIKEKNTTRQIPVIHIDDGDGVFLCSVKNNFSSYEFKEGDISEVTCKKCLVTYYIYKGIELRIMHPLLKKEKVNV